MSKILKPDNSQIWRADSLDIGIREHFKPTPENKNTLNAVIIQEDGIERSIGVVSAEQIREHGLKHGHTLN
ncbi:MAG: hypothetical protein AB4368_11565 [Xenococcaceae cyanobacterium]